MPTEIRHDRISAYVAGPLYGSGHVDDNIKRALHAAELVRENGAVPFVPHMFVFWHFRHEHPEDYWLAMDRHWLLKCDVLLVLPGVSPGSRKEEAWAAEAGIPVKHLPPEPKWVDVHNAIAYLPPEHRGSPETHERHGAKP